MPSEKRQLDSLRRPCDQPRAVESSTAWMWRRPNAVGCYPGPGTATKQVLVLKADRLLADLLCTVVHSTLPGCSITTVHTLSDAQPIVAAGVDLIISGVVAADGDLLDALIDWATHGVARHGVFVVTQHKEPVVLNSLSGAPIAGVFDQAGEGPSDLRKALMKVSSGGTYWSLSIRDALARTCRSRSSVFRQLTFTEQLVMAVIGDGRDDASAASQLGMSETTMMTMRRNLHRKLGIQHKGELVRFAIANGFVLMSPYGIIRPGFRGMMALRKNRFRKRHADASEARLDPGMWSPPLGRVA